VQTREIYSLRLEYDHYAFFCRTGIFHPVRTFQGQSARPVRWRADAAAVAAAGQHPSLLKKAPTAAQNLPLLTSLSLRCVPAVSRPPPTRHTSPDLEAGSNRVARSDASLLIVLDRKQLRPVGRTQILRAGVDFTAVAGFMKLPRPNKWSVPASTGVGLAGVNFAGVKIDSGISSAPPTTGHPQERRVIWSR